MIQNNTNKFLILEFKNAGLFRKHKKTKDKMFDMFGKKDRLESQEFIEPITVHQISNMLHVLFGERPKPINRETVYDKIPYIFEKACNSYLKIDSFKDDKNQYQKHTIQTKKSVGNSWLTSSYMNWNRVYKLLGDELYTLFKQTISDVYQINITNTSFNKVKEIILNQPDTRIDNLFKFLNTKSKKPIYDFVYGKGNEPTNINKNSRTQLTIISGLDKIIRLDGTILVPVSDDDLDKIKNSKGCVTILDNGLVYIKGVKSNNIINTDDFTKVNEISLEKQ